MARMNGDMDDERVAVKMKDIAAGKGIDYNAE